MFFRQSNENFIVVDGLSAYAACAHDKKRIGSWLTHSGQFIENISQIFFPVSKSACRIRFSMMPGSDFPCSRMLVFDAKNLASNGLVRKVIECAQIRGRRNDEFDARVNNPSHISRISHANTGRTCSLGNFLSKFSQGTQKFLAALFEKITREPSRKSGFDHFRVGIRPAVTDLD